MPPHESEQIVAALQRHGIPVEYLTFPDEGHGFLKRDNRRTAYRGVMGFLAGICWTGLTAGRTEGMTAMLRIWGREIRPT